ncbi:glycosyltransferase family 2 protein [Alcanivorax sp. S6407]|uniref:glycosyltransferase family 2 protein n=1 Tax=Alcanivorax sp. S6407 TaxID=2926424 RepID=UPI001FF324BB|nr:glycosyltransferase family A protein [Alcanivorax sp. S6407]MCK0152812.1 glycosyltransferase family 2 protein [Alcanivorax sp. S6407]
MALPLLAIVVPTFNRSENLERLLKAFSASGVVEEAAFVVIDDASRRSVKSELARLSRLYPFAQFEFFDRNQGAPNARNRGAECIDSEWLWFIDDDDVVEPSVFKDVVGFIRQDGVRDIVFLEARNISQESVSVASMQGDNLHDYLARYGQTVNTSCTLMRRKLFDRIGGWDPQLVAGQDTDLFLRASEFSDASIGKGIFIDIVHDANDRITRNAKRQMIGKIQFLRKNWSRLHWVRRMRYVATFVLCVPYIKKLL